jgi:hypothetical protein
VSATVKNRPLLISLGIILLIFLAGLYLERMYGVTNIITNAIGAPTEAYHAQWRRLPAAVDPNTNLELLGSFGHYIASVRSVISLAVSAGFFWAGYVIYRKNIEVA